MSRHGITPEILQGTGKTLVGIHRVTGIDTGYLSRIFAGKQRPSLKVAQQIAACLGWSIDDLTVKLDAARESRQQTKEKE